MNLSERVNRCVSSPLRDIFTAIESTGMISFAGGLPDEQTFPAVADLCEAFTESVYNPESSNRGNVEFCQYGASSGEAYLRDWVESYLHTNGLDVEARQIIILSGSQQGIDLSAKLLIDKGTGVSLFYPSYLAALQSLSLYGARFQPLIAEIDGRYNLERSTAVYVNPTYSNPTSSNLTLQQRESLASSCDRYNNVLVEDDAYRELYYQKSDRRPVCSFLRQANWIYLSSFSKTIAPGLRVGFMAVSEDLLGYMTRLKQASDLHTSRLSQQAVVHLLSRENYPDTLQSLRLHYKNKRDHFDAVLQLYWLDIAEWELPEGGMFFWLKLKQPLRCPMAEVLEYALETGVAFMPGEYFYPAGTEGVDSSGSNASAARTLRLNFTNASAEEASTGLRKLAHLMRKHLCYEF